ncbi:hypothetical protein LTSEINV_5283 [Salmonella enterica subsp. enterica serovar Inverness str. R8-3668]|uniref:Uncharacterized protein n=1 Tax=Salmonella enterica subsp. enterica serovar Inverness str. R8-3668 TaxID=913075 RepID=G5NJM3_SALET|nr:hypothetical protein LTSEINV_5283 [Salmonella enterica subsp. enterica serovar Inverness str. R8-3668]
MRNSSQQTADDNCHFLSIYYGFLFICQDSIAIDRFFLLWFSDRDRFFLLWFSAFF